MRCRDMIVPATACALAAALLSGCACTAGSTDDVKGAGDMRLTSTQFADGATLPAASAKTQGNRSPALSWEGRPRETMSYVLVCVDLAPIAHEWVHWMVVDIPPGMTQLSAGASGGAMPDAARELLNGFGERGWGGPQPPPGSGTHTYRFTVYALDVAKLDVDDEAALDDVLAAIEGHALATCVLEGTYGR